MNRVNLAGTTRIENLLSSVPVGLDQLEARLLQLFSSARFFELEIVARQALIANPRSSVALKAIIAALKVTERPNEALKFVVSGVEQFPDDDELLSLAGAVYGDCHLMTDAIAAYQRAISVAPTNAEHWYNLGVTFGSTQNHSEAETAYRKCLAIAPRHAGALNNLGSMQMMAGKLAEAEKQFLKLLKLGSAQESAKLNLATLLLMQGKVDRAEVLARQLIFEQAPSAEALFLFGTICAEQGRMLEAEHAFVRAHEIQPQVAEYAFAAAFLMPRVPQSIEQIHAYRARCRDWMRNLSGGNLLNGSDSRSISSPTFYLAYHGMSDRDLAVEIAEFFETKKTDRLREVEAFCPSVSRDKKSLGKIRLGVCSEFLRDHTIGHLYLGLLNEIDPSRFSITLIHPPAAKVVSVEDRTAGHDMPELRLNRSLEMQYRQISELNLDVMFYPDVGMSYEAYKLAFGRHAPVQVVGWGHPDTTGLPEIDYFLSSALIEKEGAEEHYSERLVRLNKLPTYYPVPEWKVTRDRRSFGVARHDTVYACPQSLFKFHPDFDAVLDDVLRLDPSGKLLIIEGAMESWTSLLKQRWRGKFPALLDRSIVVPRLKRPDFMSLLAGCDVLLDPIHFGSGNTLYEAFAVGTPIVTWPGEFMRGRIVAGAYKQMGISDAPIAVSLSEYATVASDLGMDAERRVQLREEIRSRAPTSLFSDLEAVREFESFIEDAVTASRSGGFLPGDWRPDLAKRS